VTVEVVDEALGSDEQRARFAAADLVLAGRYHPAVFAIAAEVPLVCIPYEHKASGVMAAAGVSDLALELDEVDEVVLTALLQRALEDEGEVRGRLAVGAARLRTLSSRTSDLAAACVGIRA
jgi:polysaccharide pyruvyl transferase WcaK-like protein